MTPQGPSPKFRSQTAAWDRAPWPVFSGTALPAKHALGQLGERFSAVGDEPKRGPAPLAERDDEAEGGGDRGPVRRPRGGEDAHLTGRVDGQVHELSIDECKGS